jgi:hypothetical protein
MVSLGTPSSTKDAMPLQLIDKYEVIERPEYSAVLDDFRDDATGEQMVLMHIEFFMTLFTPSAMKRLIEDWSTFRSVTDAPLYGLEPEPDDTSGNALSPILDFRTPIHELIAQTASHGACS